MELYEHDLEFHLNKKFTSVWGSNLGASVGNCTATRKNALRCDGQHAEKSSWHMWTVSEFYRLGCIQTTHLPKVSECCNTGSSVV